MKTRTDYHDKLFDDGSLILLIEQSIMRLAKLEKHFDSIAFTGASGMFVAPAVAAALGKRMTLVRKPKDDSHFSQMNKRLVEGAIDCRYVILDDFVMSGHTVRNIQKVIIAETGESRCVGIYEYAADKWLPFNQEDSWLFVARPPRCRDAAASYNRSD